MFSLAGISSLFCVVFGLLCNNDVSYDITFKEETRETVEALIKRVDSLQQKTHVPYKPPMDWEKRQGMWESDVKFYFHGDAEMHLLREVFAVYDNNMFASAWIASCLLEAFRFGNTTKPPQETFTSALAAIKDYHNKNVPYNNSLMTFWPQLYNETSKMWISYPINIHHLFDLVEGQDFTWLEKILRDIGLGDIAHVIESLMEIKDILLQAFEIPPDFDDTFVNLGLGSLLSEVKDEFPDAHAQWTSQNTNVTSVFDALKMYAYRPMSDREAVNTIDPRTYFVVRHFLEEAKARGEDIALVPTWVQDIDEATRARGVVMPFNINNVDVTVAANTIYGITAGVLSGVVDVKTLDDADIQQIYLNTSSLMAAMIRTNFTSRHDLALLYYPSATEFYWFTARTYAELNSRAQTGPLPHPILDTVKTILDKSLHDHMTPAILKQTKVDADDNVYLDDFLGDGDLDWHNDTVIRGEDRLFTTGMAINALLSTWTTFDDVTRRLVWQKDTPDIVKDTVQKAVGFVKKHILGDEYKPWNAFFSGSVKGKSTFPNYPCNRNENKTQYGMHGMEGVIPEADYLRMLREDNSTLDFHGFNSYADFWPFWSSEPYTYVTTMLALAKFSNTHEPS